MSRVFRQILPERGRAAGSGRRPLKKFLFQFILLAPKTIFEFPGATMKLLMGVHEDLT